MRIRIVSNKIAVVLIARLCRALGFKNNGKIKTESENLPLLLVCISGKYYRYIGEYQLPNGTGTDMNYEDYEG